jgi:hypothetical protein
MAGIAGDNELAAAFENVRAAFRYLLNERCAACFAVNVFERTADDTAARCSLGVKQACSPRVCGGIQRRREVLVPVHALTLMTIG